MHNIEDALELFEEILQQSKFKNNYYRVPRDDLDYQFGIEGFCNIQLLKIEEDIIVRCFAFTSLSSQDITYELCLKMISYDYISDFGSFCLSPDGNINFSHKLAFSTLNLEELETVIVKISKGSNEAMKMLQEEI